jgi:hypothetical protein
VCNRGAIAIGVSPFMKALHLDHHHGFVVSLDGCTSWPMVDERRWILQLEVEAAISGSYTSTEKFYSGGCKPIYSGVFRNRQC